MVLAGGCLVEAVAREGCEARMQTMDSRLLGLGRREAEREGAGVAPGWGVECGATGAGTRGPDPQCEM